MSRSRGCCLPSHHTRDSPTPKTHPAPNVNNAKTEKSCLRESVVLEQVHCSTPHLCEVCFLLTLIQVRRDTQEEYLDSLVLSSLVDTVTVFDSHLENERGGAEGNNRWQPIKKKLELKSTCISRVHWKKDPCFSVSLGCMDHDCNHLKRDYLQEDIENRDGQQGVKAK